MPQDLVVFICATFSDLRAERAAVLQAAEALRVKYDAMEYFGARAARPLDVCLEEVRRSDLLVVIVGHRYGTIVPGQDISFSEAEYQLAVQLGKPCYVLFASDEVPVPPKDTEQDPEKLRKLQAWKRRLAEDHTVAYFKSTEELVTRVVTALTRALEAQRATPEPNAPSAVQIGVGEIFSEVEGLMGAALAAGYPKAVVAGAIRSALSGFVKTDHVNGIKVLVLSGGKFAELRQQIAAALTKEGANVRIEPLIGSTFEPGELTRMLESVEMVFVLTSGGPLPEPSLLREVEAAMWRFLLLPHSVELVPVSINEAAVPPLLRTKRQILIESEKPESGIREIVEALRNYRTRSHPIR